MAALIVCLGLLVALHHGIMPMDHGSTMPMDHSHDRAAAVAMGAAMVCAGVLAAGFAICPEVGAERRLRPYRDLGTSTADFVPASVDEARSRAGPTISEVLRL
ncbi:MAG: hypothetical protein JST59_25080 [Actinobacteria bacterium]|nr:hypothetical protein [Actinomycetota bacterium]